ncbi:MAG: hypothetical protein E6K77_01795 [Candidatus Eisenbacteria bacterium]|uniref:DUF5723 domain-containing protein n=1 Tax=Eiseniibacteriota bacterium TaxID=2212470 RepID=A0A538TRB3_UNCEI|nr:MAG: hypothetical protein E6K77_01795 [Candidatus Eisenbacteria bacterium]
MLRNGCLAILMLTLGLPFGVAQGQMLDARRLGMGGVVTSDVGDYTGSNIAFRAVPKGTGGSGSIPLPLGLIQYLADHPTFDSKDSTFNIYEVANVLLNPPLTIKLWQPSEVTGDISIFVAQDSLKVDLADVKRVIPKDSMKQGGVFHVGGFSKSFGKVFLAMSPLIHVKNELTLSDNLRDALRDAVPFTGNTRYGLKDEARAQAAISFQVGYALRALYRPSPDEGQNADPRRNGSTSLYLGAAPKYLLGLAYGDAHSIAGATTGDTLFAGSNPVTIDMDTQTRHAVVGGDGGMGSGLGSDVGAVLYWRNFELGLGLNDFGSQIRWSTTVRRHAYDDSTNQFTTTEVASGERFVSRIPVTTTVNVAKRIGRTTIAADVVNGDFRTSMHAGAEFWFGMLALRSGLSRDQNKMAQFAGGAGYRLGKIGIDLAIATNSRNIERERGAELSASLSLY